MNDTSTYITHGNEEYTPFSCTLTWRTSFMYFGKSIITTKYAQQPNASANISANTGELVKMAFHGVFGAFVSSRWNCFNCFRKNSFSWALMNGWVFGQLVHSNACWFITSITCSLLECYRMLYMILTNKNDIIAPTVPQI